MYITKCFRCGKEEKTYGGARHPSTWFEISKFEIHGIAVDLTESRFACSVSCLKDLIANLKHEVMNRIPK